MKYLVLKQLGIERKLKTRHDSTSVAKDDTHSDIISRHFLSGHAKKTRRFRSAFTTEQIKYLENEFKKFPYIGSGNRKEVSSILNIPERAVKIWFQNRRMKEKKDVTKEKVDEEQNKINVARPGPSNIFNHRSHFTQPHTICQSETNTSIKHVSGTNLYASHGSAKSIPDQQKAIEKNWNYRNITNANNSRIVNKVAPASQQFNNKAYVPTYVRIKQELLENHNHGIIKQEDPTEIQESHNPQVIHPNFYQINPNQEKRNMPVHVQILPQPPPFVPGNILWKQVNVMPVLPGIATSPPQVHNNSFSVMHPNYPKDDCKCNCNAYNTSQDMGHLMQIDGPLHLQSQYILAMPFENHFDSI